MKACQLGRRFDAVEVNVFRIDGDVLDEVAGKQVVVLHDDAQLTVHGMRSTFWQWCEREKVRYEVAETALGHAVGGKVERAYQRDDLLAERREVMRRRADYLTG